MNEEAVSDSLTFPGKQQVHLFERAMWGATTPRQKAPGQAGDPPTSWVGMDLFSSHVTIVFSWTLQVQGPNHRTKDIEAMIILALLLLGSTVPTDGVRTTPIEFHGVPCAKACEQHGPAPFRSPEAGVGRNLEI